MSSHDDDLERKISDARLFTKIYEYLHDRPHSSFREIADHLEEGLTAQKISSFIDRLEASLGGRLIDRKAKSKNNTLTGAAERAYKQAGRVLESVASWPRREKDVIRIGASNMLFHLVLPRIIPSYRKHIIDNKIDADVRIFEHLDPLEIVRRIIEGDLDFALIWVNEERIEEIERIIKSMRSRAQLEVNHFGVKFDFLMVCPPGHRFVEEAKAFEKKAAEKSPGLGNRWQLDLAELADELVYILPPSRQPFYDHLPPPSVPSKERLVQDSFLKIISMVRCHVRQGVGLVPGIYPELDEMRRRGQIFYAPIAPIKGRDPETGNPRQVAFKIWIGCVTRTGIKNLREPARVFFDKAEPKIKELSEISYAPEVIKHLPKNIDEYEKYSYCYFVMQEDEMFGVPKWFRGKLNLARPSAGESRASTQFVPDLIGEFFPQTKYKGRRRVWEFDVHACLRGETERDRILQVVGAAKKPDRSQGETERRKPDQIHINTIICNYNMKVVAEVETMEYKALLGVWSGCNDEGLPTIAPMVLTNKPLPNLETLRQIVNKVSFRCLPNADELDNDDDLDEDGLEVLDEDLE
jgi:DNA-binding transcriptional LysR family regulator